MQSKKTDRKKKRVIAKQTRTKTSIVCGTENPASLGCDFYELEDGELATFFTPKEIHEPSRRKSSEPVILCAIFAA